jgi:hypothetical protein
LEQLALVGLLQQHQEGLLQLVLQQEQLWPLLVVVLQLQLQLWKQPQWELLL